MLGLFERTAQGWQTLGAPALLWDDEEAVRVARLVYRPGFRLDTLEGPRSQLERVLVRRLRADVAGPALERAGQLTERERMHMERWPPFRPPRRAPGTWRAGVSVAAVLDGRLPEAPA